MLNVKRKMKKTRENKKNMKNNFSTQKLKREDNSLNTKHDMNYYHYPYPYYPPNNNNWYQNPNEYGRYMNNSDYHYYDQFSQMYDGMYSYYADSFPPNQNDLKNSMEDRFPDSFNRRGNDPNDPYQYVEWAYPRYRSKTNRAYGYPNTNANPGSQYRGYWLNSNFIPNYSQNNYSPPDITIPEKNGLRNNYNHNQTKISDQEQKEKKIHQKEKETSYFLLKNEKEAELILKNSQSILNQNKMKEVVLDWIYDKEFLLNYSKVDFLNNHNSELRKLDCDLLTLDRFKTDEAIDLVFKKEANKNYNDDETKDIQLSEIFESKGQNIFKFCENKNIAKKVQKLLQSVKDISIFKKIYDGWFPNINTLLIKDYSHLLIIEILNSNEVIESMIEVFFENLDFLLLNSCSQRVAKLILERVSPEHKFVQKVIKFVTNNHLNMTQDINFATLATFLVKLFGAKPFKNVVSFLKENMNLIYGKNKIKKFYVSLILEINDRNTLLDIYLELKPHLIKLVKSLYGNKIVEHFIKKNIGNCLSEVIRISKIKFPKFFSFKSSKRLILPYLEKKENNNLIEKYCDAFEKFDIDKDHKRLTDAVKSESGSTILLYLLISSDNCRKEILYLNLMSTILKNFRSVAKSRFVHDMANVLHQYWKITCNNKKLNQKIKLDDQDNKYKQNMEDHEDHEESLVRESRKFSGSLSKNESSGNWIKISENRKLDEDKTYEQNQIIEDDGGRRPSDIENKFGYSQEKSDSIYVKEGQEISSERAEISPEDIETGDLDEDQNYEVRSEIQELNENLVFQLPGSSTLEGSKNDNDKTKTGECIDLKELANRIKHTSLPKGKSRRTMSSHF